MPILLAGLLLSVVIISVGCGNPAAGPAPDAIGSETDTGGDTGGGSGSGGGSGATDVPPTPITITFVLDMDSGETSEFGVLNTSATAPAPLAATAGVPVRLDQGIGFTATASPEGAPTTWTFHASGWSEEPYDVQFEKIMGREAGNAAPTGEGYFLPGFEATFTEDTTLYVRWLPELDYITAQLTYIDPANPSNTSPGPIVHLRDELPLETMTHFKDRVSPSWSADETHHVYGWESRTRTFSHNATQYSYAPTVWQFAVTSFGDLITTTPLENAILEQIGLRPITLTYESKRVHAITFDYAGATGGNSIQTLYAYEGVPLSDYRSWTDFGSFILPIRDSLNFGGWYSGTDFDSATAWSTGTAWSFQSPNTAVTLHARWQADVTFNPGGGNGGIVTQTLDVDTEGTVPVPTATTPHDTWDVFAGWFADSAYTQPVTLTGGRLPVTGNRTVYAGWGPKYAIDDPGPGGGRIFHIHGGTDPRTTVGNPQGSGPGMQWRYLEVAPTDAAGVGSWATPSMLDTFFTDPSHDSLGRGVTATDQIIGANSGTTFTDYAALVVHNDYSSNGLSDWYLPSVVELKEIATSGVWQTVSMGSQVYWSSSSYINLDYSTESMGTRAFTVQLSSGAPVVGTTERGTGGGALRARPIRRF